MNVQSIILYIFMNDQLPNSYTFMNVQPFNSYTFMNIYAIYYIHLFKSIVDNMLW